jgi:hypothetical protein
LLSPEETADAYGGVDVLKIAGGGLTGKKVKGAGPQRMVRQPERRFHVVPASPRVRLHVLDPAA